MKLAFMVLYRTYVDGRAGKGFTLFISNEDMDGINRIIKSLEDSGVLTDGVTDTVRNEVGFHGTISAPML